MKILGHFFFMKKLCMGKHTFLGKFVVGLLYMGTNDQIMQWGRKRFQYAFFNNLNAANRKDFSSHGGRHTCK